MSRPHALVRSIGAACAIAACGLPAENPKEWNAPPSTKTRLVVMGTRSTFQEAPPVDQSQTMSTRGSVNGGDTQWYQTPALGPGTYVVQMSADGAQGGDADLYVRAGSWPTSSQYDCRPYAETSNESCTVTLAAQAQIYIAISGYAQQASPYVLKLFQLSPATAAQWRRMDRSGTVAANQDMTFETPALLPGKYEVTLTGTGDADLYVKKGGAPTIAGFDCRSFGETSTERCEITLNEPGVIYVLVHGYAQSSTFQMVIQVMGATLPDGGANPDGGVYTWPDAGVGPPPPPPGGWAGGQTTGVVYANQEVVFQTPTLTAGRYLISLSGTANADLYVRFNALPNVYQFDCRPYLYTSDEACLLTIANPAVAFMMVRGVAYASNYTLTALPY